MMTKRILPLTILLLCFLSELTFGQTNTGNRPKIAYVLSGGGAKGMAHVGVLKVLEEVGLEPDFITGTSMGSIMGGFYSIGYSADEIADQCNYPDFPAVRCHGCSVADAPGGLFNHARPRRILTIQFWRWGEDYEPGRSRSKDSD